MTLLLDTRQRAMLQAMGITLWSAEPLAIKSPAQTAAKAHQPQAVAAPQIRPTALQAPARTNTTSASKTSTNNTTAASNPINRATTNNAGWVLHAPKRLFETLSTPAKQPPLNALVTEQVRQARWLIVAQNASPAQPLAGDWGALLGNMLQAMGLHQHPNVWITTLEAPLSAALMPAGAAGVSNPPDITDTITQLAPDMVLLFGAVAARAALGHERAAAPLGQLRGQVHLIGQQPNQHPAIVTYDPSFLLRSANHKAGAWADVCTALAHINQSQAAYL